ncbi:hypothetical protein [Paracoccus sphaerophysae]|uniref:hypothetical protein n=1 Tax=Paracoccus sphaerophysae TaxID=690417 RepID=UPI002356196E|nr:hypothetical protein [Paracoccus sphaerophysae]
MTTDDQTLQIIRAAFRAAYDQQVNNQTALGIAHLKLRDAGLAVPDDMLAFASEGAVTAAMVGKRGLFHADADGTPILPPPLKARKPRKNGWPRQR